MKEKEQEKEGEKVTETVKGDKEGYKEGEIPVKEDEKKNKTEIAKTPILVVLSLGTFHLFCEILDKFERV